MALEDDIRALERAPLIGEIGRDALRLLAFSAETRRLAQDEILFRKGDRADGAYVIVRGEVAFLTDEGVSIRRVGPGALIGEISLIVEGERAFTARAENPTAVILLSRTVFRRMLEEFPEIVTALQIRLGERLRADQEALARVQGHLGALDTGSG